MATTRNHFKNIIYGLAHIVQKKNNMYENKMLSLCCKVKKKKKKR